MARQLPLTIAIDEAETEVLFTRAALKADPNAVDLMGLTDPWLSYVDGARGATRTADEAVAEADAARIIANLHLDGSCTTFGDDLFVAVGKNRQDTRWTQFFPNTVSSFVRQALPRQVDTVMGWLRTSSDQVLEKHRPELQRWATAAADAIERTRATSLVRGQARLKREEMAQALTRERDGLRDALAARARERGLPRSWPDAFFRVDRSRRDAGQPQPDTDPADVPSPQT